MGRLCIFIIWLPCVLASLIATNPPSKQSCQILFKENVFSYKHSWSIYLGPQGIPVNPCAVAPFLKVDAPEGDVIPDGSIDAPPFTPKGTWSGLPQLYEGVDCLIVGDGEGPPTLQCGQNLVVKFAKDMRYGYNSIICNDAFRYHWGYAAEYTV